MGIAGTVPAASAVHAATASSAVPRSIRLAHFTDVHLDDVHKATDLLARCFRAVQSMEDPPEVILNGGDTIMDALGREKQDVAAQWQLWHQIVKSECDLQIIHCIGNHDVWGAGDRDDALYGKGWALQEMQLRQPYYSLDRAGWHFVILDSTHPVDDGWYTGKLDDAQFDWLAADLAAVPADVPVLVMSHIPILTATAFYPENIREGDHLVPGGWMHIDFGRIKDLFARHQQVKVCISGHMHLLDRVDYNGVNYLCNGAVSGGWWGDPVYRDTRAGYAIIDLFADGTVAREYVEFPWA